MRHAGHNSRSIRAAGAVMLALVGLVPAVAAAPAAPAGAPGSPVVAGPAATETRSGPTVGRWEAGNTEDWSPLTLDVATELPRLPHPTAEEMPAGAGLTTSAAAEEPPPPSLATTSAAPAATLAGFPGLTNDSNAGPFREPGGSFAAAGPNEVVQVANQVVRISGRDGSGAEIIPLNVLFPLDDPAFPVSGIDGWGDPRVLYDVVQQRWLITMLAYDCNTTLSRGYLLGAVSVDARPFFWNGFYLDYTDADDGIGYLPESPAIASSTDKVVIGANEFALSNTADCTSGTAYSGASLVAIDWTALRLNPIQVFEIGYVLRPDAYSLRPASQPLPDSAAVGVIGETNIGPGGSDVLYGQITGSANAGTVAFTNVVNLTAAGTVAQFVDPPQPSDAGGQIGADVVDRRPTDAVQRGNSLTFASTRPCSHGGDGTTRSCARVTEIRVDSGPSIYQDTLFGAAGTFAYHAGIGRGSDGTLHVAWSGSSGSTGISSTARYQRPSDGAGSFSPPVVVGAGAGAAYVGDRWFEYLGIAMDPVDSTGAWIAAPHTAGGGGWGTQMVQIQTPGADYVPLDPVRLLDTRTGNGLSGASTSDVVRTVQIAGRGGVPNHAIAVTGNLAVTGQNGAGYVTIAPSLTSTPSTSTINFPLNDTRANNTTVQLSASGTLSLVYKASPGRTTHVLLDITGYFTKTAAGATYSTVTPVRLLDTRTNNGLSGQFTSDVPRSWQITGRGGVPANASAITANVTVTGQSGAGYVSLTPTQVANPTTSSINFPVGDNRANGAAVPLGPGGTLSATYKAGPGRTTHLILDVTGYFVNDASGKRFVPLAPGRRLDTRTDTGLSGVMVANTARTLQVRPHLGVATNATAVTGNLTVTAQTAAGYVSLTQTATSTPTTSTINFPVADNRANGVFAPLSGTGSVGLVYKAGSGRTTHLILDITGYFR